MAPLPNFPPASSEAVPATVAMATVLAITLSPIAFDTPGVAHFANAEPMKPEANLPPDNCKHDAQNQLNDPLCSIVGKTIVDQKTDFLYSIALEEFKISFSGHARSLHVSSNYMYCHILLLWNNNRTGNTRLTHRDMRTFLAFFLEAVSLKYSNKCIPISWR